MKHSTGIVLTTVVALLLTGCVKPTGEANTTGTNTQTFDDTATNGTFTPTYAEGTGTYDTTTNTTGYDTTNTTTNTTGYDTGSSGTVYGTTTIDNTVVTTDATYGATDTYTNTVPANTTYDNITYGTTPTTTTPTYDNVVTTPATTYGTGGGAYGNPNATNGGYATTTNNDIYGTSSSTNSGGYNDTYSSTPTTSTGGYNDTYSSTPSTNTGTYTTNNSYGSNSSSTSATGGIHLQVAALKDYYAATEYKNNLSLDPKYSAYVKKGRINKVIVTGLPSRAVAKALAAKQFPGAFIVAGSPLSSSSSSSYNNNYSSNSSYSSSSSSSSSSSNGSSYSGNGIGVQVGAFSSYSAAKTAAKRAAGSRYTALVKTVDSRGKKLYKAIVTGFSSASSARSAIASGEFANAFLVTNLK